MYHISQPQKSKNDSKPHYDSITGSPYPTTKTDFRTSLTDELFTQASKPINSKQLTVQPVKEDSNGKEENHARFRRDIGTLQHFETAPRNVSKPTESTQGSNGSSEPSGKALRKSTPYATDLSLKEQFEATEKMEKELVSLLFQRSEWESELQKLDQKRGKTHMGLQRKVQLESNIQEITKKISMLKLQLKDKGV